MLGIMKLVEEIALDRQEVAVDVLIAILTVKATGRQVMIGGNGVAVELGIAAVVAAQVVVGSVRPILVDHQAAK